MKGDPAFARAVLSLSTTGAPWDTFVAALRQRHLAAMTALTNAPPQDIYTEQGRARAFAELLSVLEAAPKVANQGK